MTNNATGGAESLQETPGENSLREQLADMLYDGALTLAYSVGHDIGELTDIVAGLAGRGIMLVPAVGNATKFAAATADSLYGDTKNTQQSDFVLVHRRAGGPTSSINRGELTTEEYIEALAAAVKGEASRLGECSREGCSRPAIEAKPGYVGPLYCSPVHAFVDRANREGGA